MGTWEGLLSTMNRPNEVKHLTALRWARHGATVNLELRVCISSFGVVFPFPQTVSGRCCWESPADPSLYLVGTEEAEPRVPVCPRSSGPGGGAEWKDTCFLC